MADIVSKSYSAFARGEHDRIFDKKCEACNGLGRKNDIPCKECNGTGNKKD